MSNISDKSGIRTAQLDNGPGEFAGPIINSELLVLRDYASNR
jgi:hypothetical protein